jgi:chromosome segregation ATPase
MARDVSMMFDELRRLTDRHAELSTEAGTLRAELEGGRSHVADLEGELDRVQTRSARLEVEAHGTRLDTAAASRMADEANRRAADLADKLTAVINEKAEALKALEAERRRSWWRRLWGGGR